MKEVGIAASEPIQWLTDKKKKRVGITRSKAKALLVEIVVRARMVNRNPEFCWGVFRIEVFGSYVAGDKDKLGDLDVTITLGPKCRDVERHERIEDERRKKATRKRAWLEVLFYPRTVVMQFLRNGHAAYSFCPPEDLKRMVEADAAASQCIYQNKRLDPEPYYAKKRLVR